MLRRVSQIDPRTKYFQVVREIDQGTVPSLSDVTFVLKPEYTQSIPRVVADTFFKNTMTLSPFNIHLVDGALLKDMGRTIYGYDSNYGVSAGSLRQSVYREVQIVNGADSEGVSGSSANNWNTFWVRVWSSTTGDDSVNRIAPIARIGPGA